MCGEENDRKVIADDSLHNCLNSTDSEEFNSERCENASGFNHEKKKKRKLTRPLLDRHVYDL